jgi:hypothetical protein
MWGNKSNQIQTEISWGGGGGPPFTPGYGEANGSTHMSFPESSYSSLNQRTPAPKLPNPNQSSNPTITIHKCRISRLHAHVDRVMWVHISALYVRTDAPITQVITAHLDGEVIVPPALAVMGVLRAAVATPFSASAAASATATTVAVVRRARTGHGARWGGRRGYVALV